jgi:hypothetical protein
MQQPRETIKRDAPYLRDRFGQLKAHPAVGVERDARTGFSHALRDLDLDRRRKPDRHDPFADVDAAGDFRVRRSEGVRQRSLGCG